MKEVIFIKILKLLFEKGKKEPKFMRFMANIYNICSFTKKKIKGKGNYIDKRFAFLRKNRITINGSNNQIILGNGARLINCNIYIYGNNNVLFIDDGCYCINSEFYFEDEFCRIEMGCKTSSLGVHFAATEPNSKIKIGEKCLFSSDIEIRTGDSHSIIDTNTNKRINYAKDVNIEDHVWIGAHARILKGSKISKNSVVANSAVVTKEFDKGNCIIGGFPAKIIGENINWKNERIYE